MIRPRPFPKHTPYINLHPFRETTDTQRILFSPVRPFSNSHAYPVETIKSLVVPTLITLATRENMKRNLNRLSNDPRELTSLQTGTMVINKTFFKLDA